MDREKAHKNIEQFLKNRTNLQSSIEKEIIYRELEKREIQISEQTVKEYLIMHNSEINEKVKETMDALVWEMLPENPIVTIIKRFDLWTFLLVPPLYPLLSYAAFLLSQENKDWFDIGTVLASLFIIFCFLVASLVKNVFCKRD